ncbi:MAG TPA: DUF885 family protein, partial [Allosphingosinicella sp.]
MRAFLIAASLLIASPAAAAPADDLHALMEEHYQWLLRENPVAATRLGVRDFDDRLRDISPAARDRRAREAQAFLDRLQRIPEGALTDEDRVNRAILIRDLTEQVEGNRFAQ